MLEAKTWGVGDAHNASNLQKVQEIWLQNMARVKTVSRNLGFFLSDDHLTKHVAGTEEVLQGNLIRVPPNKRLPEETFFSPPWTENVNPSAFPIPEMIDLAAFCLSDISSDNNHLHNFQHTMLKPIWQHGMNLFAVHLPSHELQLKFFDSILMKIENSIS